MAVTVISSLQNERVKLIRALQGSGKSRRKENRIVLEGVRLIDDALTSGIQPDFIFYNEPTVHAKAGNDAGDTIMIDSSAARRDGQTGSRLFDSAFKSSFDALLHALRGKNIPCLEVTSEVMTHVSDTETPQGILAVVPIPELPLPEKRDFILILDGVADPGNLGTILRTAAASGVDVVILAPRCVDPFNPKVLRGGMGAHFRIPVVRSSWQAINAEYGHLQTALADAAGVTAYYNVDWCKPSAVVIGGEAFGAAEESRQFAHTVISIPMAGTTESLNASVAAGILLFEIRRQRSS